jgi:hypothetical protein
MPKTVEVEMEAWLNTMRFIGEELPRKVAAAQLQSTQDGEQVAKDLSAVKTGYLRSRWKAELVESTRTRIVTTLSNDAPYAVPVIFGHRTASGSWVPPRDSLTPAMLHIRRQLASRFADLHFTLRG